jgi:thioredoxin 1
MKRLSLYAIVAAAIAAVLAAAWIGFAERPLDHALAAASAVASKPAKALSSEPKVTFLELGSVGCKPCDAMRPVMDTVRRKHGDKVDVVFHDVRKDGSAAQKYRVFLIPTQVFLDSQGREVFRHEGFLALEKVEEVLRQLGVQ